MPAVGVQTYAATIVAAAEIGGWLKYRGTATAGATTSLTDANNTRLPTAESGAMLGLFIYMDAGTGIGQAREITVYGTIGVMTWTQTATAPDTTTTYAIMSIDPRILQRGLDRVQRLAAFNKALPYDSYSLMTDNLLHFMGDFEEWPDGNTSAPAGFVLAGASASIARDATAAEVAHGLYSAAVTSAAGAVGTLTYTVPTELLRYLGGASLYLYGMMAEQIAADAVMRVTHTNEAGTAVSGNWTGTYASGRFEELEAITPTTITTNPFTLPTIVRALTLQARTAVSTTCQYDNLFLGGPRLYDYDIPTSLIKISPVIYMEAARASLSAGGARTPETYTIPLRHRQHWTVSQKSGSTRRRLRFFPGTPWATARHLHIHGLQIPAVVTAAGTNLNINADYAATATAAYARRTEGLSKERMAEFLELKGESERLSAQFATDIGEPWVDVEDI